MRRVAVIGVGQTKHGKRNDVNYPELVYEAVKRALEHADITIGDVDAIVTGSMPAPMEGTNDPQLWLTDALGGYLKPLMRIATCGSTGISLAHSAYYHVASGLFDVVMAAGMEKMYENDPQGTMTTVAEPFYQRIFTAGAPGIFAQQCNAYIHRYDIPKEKLREAAAEVSVRNHLDALENPYAHIRVKITVEDVLSSPVISYPVRFLDLCPISDGSCAVIFASEDFVRKAKIDRVAWVRGLSYAGDEHNFGDKDLVNWESAIKAARETYRMAGIENPIKEIDVAEIYNPFTYQEILYYELFGFCKPGEGYKLVLEGAVTKDGEIACDPSGGVLCTNPIGASGLIRVAEAALQIMGEASNQVDSCETALAHAMGGVNQFNGLMILGR
ncbi:MAG TPA: hypothetical protein ENF96_00045 [Archaeoglobus veneficus]|nr:hypothetical protein [Archaeoglobus veneficus]